MLTSCFQSSPRFRAFVRGEGVRLYDKDGGVYQDGISGIFNVNYGYGCGSIITAASHQIEQLCFLGKEYLWFEDLGLLCDKLLTLRNAKHGAVFIVSGGSEAIEAALVLAYTYHQRRGEASRRRILSRIDSYHGATLGAKSITGRQNIPRIDGAGYDVVFFPPPVNTRYPGGNNQQVWPPGAIDSLDDFVNAQEPETFSALVVEPVNHLRGMWSAPSGYLGGLQKLCKKYGILLILDEIITGFGRTGPTFAFQKEGVEPDLLCLGKGMSGGYAPAAAVVASEGVAKAFRETEDSIPRILHGHTYAGNPVAVAACLAAMDELHTLDTSGVLLKRATHFSASILDLQNALKNTVELNVHINGMLCGLQFLNAPRGIGKAVANACFSRNMIVRGEEDWVVLAPAFISDNHDIDSLTEILQDSVRAALSDEKTL